MSERNFDEDSYDEVEERLRDQDPYEKDDLNIQRFLKAQNSGNPSKYMNAISEIRNGLKVTHWIWYVLPQLRGLGGSARSKYYEISSLNEAIAYLDNPILKEHLEEITNLIFAQLSNQKLEKLMGGNLDAMKTISSLTLFELAGLECATKVLNKVSRRCSFTLNLVKELG